MDHSSGQQHHEIKTQAMENMLVSCPKSQEENRKPIRPQPDQALSCPRCDSTNTKFCYYNNYSLSQPRYFCKSCRRYWTKGGTLRNVPVGGGCRKNKRPSPSSSSTSSKRSHDHQPLSTNSSHMMITDSHLLPSLTYDSTDLSLALARLQNQSNGQMGLFDTNNNFHNSLCYGFGSGSGSSGEVENGGRLPNFEEYSTNNIASTAAVKQELCHGDQNMIFWGFPWQMNNAEGNYIGGSDSTGRENWNFNGNGNGIASSWHGLINSPLM